MWTSVGTVECVRKEGKKAGKKSKKKKKVGRSISGTEPVSFRSIGKLKTLPCTLLKTATGASLPAFMPVSKINEIHIL